MNRYIAERKLILRNADGVDNPITIKIGEPYKIDDLQWACPVQIEGMHKKLADQSGIDSFQALMLAQNLIRNLLSYFVEDGGSILSVEDKSMVDVEALFGRGI